MNLARQVAMGSQLRLRFEQEARLLKRAMEKGLRIQTKNLEALLEAKVDMKKATEAKNIELAKELESLCEERIKAAFEEFKRYEDDKVEQWCAEMDARLDKLSIYFDEKLYPHMLTAIAGCRWLIGHGLRLAVLKCAESPEVRQAFDDIMSVRLAKGMSEGLQYGIKHGKAGRDLGDVEAPIGEWICDLRPSSSQLKIPIYPEVCDPKNPWAVKEEISLDDAIAANISRAEKKKKCRVVCRTHGVGSAHHARSDGVAISVPTTAPQGLAIVLTDSATQTEGSKGEVSPRLISSKSLPPMFNLEWS
ncbi:hypothetical protein Tco_0441857 [Tanacetum coccineum]